MDPINFNDFTYTVATPNDADPKGAVIVKDGIKATFTVAAMQLEQQGVKKVIKELDSRLEIETAKYENITTHHPFISDMSDEDLFTAHMAWESKALIKALPEKIAEFNAQLKGSLDEQNHIADVLGIAVRPEDTTPAQDAAKTTPEAAQEGTPTVGVEIVKKDYKVLSEQGICVEGEADNVVHAQGEIVQLDPASEQTIHFVQSWCVEEVMPEPTEAAPAVEAVGTAVELNDESANPELSGVNIITAVDAPVGANAVYKTDKSGDTWVKASLFHKSETQPEAATA